MPYFALIYHTATDYLERRGAYRAEHLAMALQSTDRGELQLGGAFADPADTALLVFKATDRTIPETFARNDPYVLNGLVERWEVREWSVVIGAAFQ